MALNKNIRDREYNKFDKNGAVKVSENLTITEAKKQALLDASDLIKVFTYGTHDGIRMIETISFSSVAVDIFYSETITMNRNISYTGATSEINTITDILTII